MNILRSRYHGVIHFDPAGAEHPLEPEFSDGEGPEQVMNQIQDVALPEIRNSIEPLGPYLRWEELDTEAGVVRRHRTPFHDRFEFVLCPDELGIELILPAPDGGQDSRERARPWVSLRPLAEPGEEQRATIGWSVAEPEYRWRYLQTRYAPPAIEMTWSCATLPAHWAARILAGSRQLDCYFGDDQHCAMSPTRDGLLIYRGFHPLPAGSPRPASLAVLLAQPLALVGPETELGEEEHELFAEVPATVEALDFKAVIGGRPTRLVARADLDLPFETEVLTAGDLLLPEMIPAGALPGLPWDLTVSAETAAGREDARGSRQPANGSGGAPPEASSRRRWRLAPRPRPGGRDGAGGRWRDVAWEQDGPIAGGDPPSLAFGLGSYDAARAPRITHIENRRASVAWRIEASDEGGGMCLCVPHWVPVGCPGVAFSRRQIDERPPRKSNGFDYAAEVGSRLDGLEERFVIDQRSEVPANRLFLGPRRWRFRDQDHGPIAGGEALGEGAGCVRWRNPAGGHDLGLKPTDWAGGSAPVLLLEQGADNTLCWGGLYAPRAVPWDALDDVPAEPSPDLEEVLLVPRPPFPDGGEDAERRGARRPIWIDLQGFVCRYDEHRVIFTRSHGEHGEATAWIAQTGLELFPRSSGHLLRSFSPIYAVRDPEPRTFSLKPTAPRPTLHVGRELHAARRFPAGRSPSHQPAPHGPGATDPSLVLEIGAETYARCSLADRGRVPESFDPGRVPGTRLRLDRVEQRVVWLAVEQRRGEAGRRAGYLLSWDAGRGWLFRGFFAHPGAAAELGVVRRGDRSSRVFLGSEGASRVSTFRLTIGRQGARWSAAAPEEARRVTPEMIRSWEGDYFARERRPAPLSAYGMRILQQSAADRPWIFEFFDGESQAGGELPAGIRVWQLHGGAGEELAGGARELGEDTGDVELPAKPVKPVKPVKKRLSADDDDDDFFS